MISHAAFSKLWSSTNTFLGMRLSVRIGGNTFAMTCFLRLAVRSVRGPRDGAVLEIQSDKVAVVREHQAMGDLSADGGFIFQGSDLCHFANLPRAAGNHAGTVSTDVICIGQFWFAGRLILLMGEAHNYSDWDAFLHTSAKYAFDGHRRLGLAGRRSSTTRGWGPRTVRYSAQRICSTEESFHQSGEDLKWGSDNPLVLW